MGHFEKHYVSRIGLLRASVLGANDGIISTSSLIIGIASSGTSKEQLLTISIAGLVAGAMSMAAGEYVSVSSQADAENSDIERERQELIDSPEAELKELTGIYIERGLDAELAQKVAKKLTEHDALGSHLRDELGFNEIHRARPFLAAISSAMAFAGGSLCSIGIMYFVDHNKLILFESCLTLFLLFLMGGVAGKIGGGGFLKGALRISLWGGIAMGFTALIGGLF